MRAADKFTDSPFAVKKPQDFIPQNHPMRPIRKMVNEALGMKDIPNLAQNTSGPRSAVPNEITDTEGYSIWLQKRKLIEKGFGWAKTICNVRQVLVRGLRKVDQMFVLKMAAHNLTRMRFLAQLRPEAAQ